MKNLLAIAAFAVALPLSNPAHAYIKCDAKEDAKKKKKCEKKMAKSLAKMRANQTPIKPADVGSEFAYLDAKLFESDDWFLGYKASGMKDIDAVSKKVATAKGVIRLTRYAAYVNKTDKKAAQKLGGKLMPRLKNMQQELDGITQELNKVDPSKYTGMDAVKAAGAMAATTAEIAKTIGEVPGALAAIGPVVGGGVGAMVGDVMKQATGAINEAKSAVEDAKGAVDDAKKAVEDAKEATKK